MVMFSTVFDLFMRRSRALAAMGFCALLPVAVAQPVSSAVTPSSACADGSAAPCYLSFQPGPARGDFHFYASQDNASSGAAFVAPTAALIALHGHPRDANKTFAAALKAVSQANALDRTLVVSPVFQVAAAQAGKCSTAGVPAAASGDLLWTCASWLEGGVSALPDGGQGPGSFAAMDALITELHRRWPSLTTVTVAGFSAGAQMVQHAIAFAAPPPAGVRLRYVVADPGSWLYFDAMRPQPMRQGAAADWSACTGDTAGLGDCTVVMRQPDVSCAGVNRWKYGTDGLPPLLATSDAAALRAKYTAADIHYLAGARDAGSGPGTYYGILDKSCGAMAQGPYRLQRALAYAAYERAVLAPAAPRLLTIVPGCAHDVACVFPSVAARAALLGTDR